MNSFYFELLSVKFKFFNFIVSYIIFNFSIKINLYKLLFLKIVL